MTSVGQKLFRFAGAVLLAGGATAIDYRTLSLPPGTSLPVVVAARDIPEGSIVGRGSVVVAHWPGGTIPAGAYSTLESVAGRVTRVAVLKGEAIVPGRLAIPYPGLDVKITPGKRAFSFRVNDVSGIAGLIQPNTRVDIFVLIDDGEGSSVAKLFMENMRVLAIGAVPQRSQDGRLINATVCTVEVTPDEGERLAIATTQGQIQLMLRGYGDPDSLRANGPATARVVEELNRATTVRQLDRRQR